MLTSAAILALAGGAAVAPMAMADPIPAARSYAELLEPVPDAMARIHADDAMAAGEARMIPAQLNIGIGIGDAHHHHHHHHSRRWYRANGYFWNGQVWILGRPQYHHHHHHNADWYRSQGYNWDGQRWYRGERPHHHHHHHQQWR